MRTTSLIVAVAVLGACAGPALAQEDYAVGARPHSSLNVRDLAGVDVDRFQAGVRRRDGRLVVVVEALARRRAAGARTAVLRVGGCTGGPRNALSCPPQVSRRVTLSRRPSRISLVARIPVPSRDALQVTLTRPGQSYRPVRTFAHAVLELRRAAWREQRGRFFGFVSNIEGRSPDLTTVRLDVVGVNAQRARPSIALAATQISTVRTTTTTCASGGRCRASDLLRPRDGRLTFTDRPTLDRGGADTVTLRVAGTGNETLLVVRLPFPRL